MTSNSDQPSPAPPRIDLRIYGDWRQWLDEADGSVLVTTYTAGKLVALSMVQGEPQVRIWKLARPLGLALHQDRLAVAVRKEIWEFQQSTDGAPYRPLALHQTGALDVHDLAYGKRGLYFVNTRYNCIARPSDRVHFLRSWQPPFMPNMVPRDCCHLNGLGIRDAVPRMATAFGAVGQPRAWRDGDRFTSGILIDIRQNQVVAGGLCMPHSPRWHRDRWWLCDSGQGTLCTWRPGGDQVLSSCQAVSPLPGFTRGLSFAHGRALVGLSRIRERHILDAPPIGDRAALGQAGVALVDPTSGAHTGGVEFVRGGSEVYEVAFLPGDRHVRIELPSPST
jgi:uncharacterized protein (TIGR03032 family)